MTTEPNTPEYTDVSTSHDMTEAERIELDAMEVEAKAGTTDAAATAEAAAVNAEAEAAVAAAAQAEAARVASEAAAQAAPPMAAVTGPELLAVPEAPKDFAAERAALRKRYDDDDDMTAEDYDKAVDALADERAAYIAQKSIIEQTNAQRAAAHAAQVEADFNSVSAAWIAKNADFMANPLFAKDMQDAINLIDSQTNGQLPPAELFARAEKAAFQARNWTPKVDNAEAARAEANRKAAEARIPPAGPTTLSAAPSAGIDTGRSSFSDLDSGSIIDMEAAIARMTPAELEKFLAEADA